MSATAEQTVVGEKRPAEEPSNQSKQLRSEVDGENADVVPRSDNEASAHVSNGHQNGHVRSESTNGDHAKIPDLKEKLKLSNADSTSNGEPELKATSPHKETSAAESVEIMDESNGTVKNEKQTQNKETENKRKSNESGDKVIANGHSDEAVEPSKGSNGQIKAAVTESKEVIKSEQKGVMEESNEASSESSKASEVLGSPTKVTNEGSSKSVENSGEPSNAEKATDAVESSESKDKDRDQKEAEPETSKVKVPKSESSESEMNTKTASSEEPSQSKDSTSSDVVSSEQSNGSVNTNSSEESKESELDSKVGVTVSAETGETETKAVEVPEKMEVD